MDENWRSAGKKNDSRGDSSRGNGTRKSHSYGMSGDTHHRRPHSDRQLSNVKEAGSGFARNEKYSSRTHANSQRGYSVEGGTRSQTGRNHVEERGEESIELLKEEYDGVVKAVKLGRDGGLYCQYGLSGAPSFNYQGFVPRVLFNNKDKRPFQKGDKIKVRCVSKEPVVELCLTAEYVRPLLILDINGPLGDRSSYCPKDKGKKRTFTKRNHLDSFLSLVAEHFEIAIWSCCAKKNIELSLFLGINLMFVWCNEESTSLYPRTSFISPAKPLFLKEIEKVWQRYPSFNASNTLLLDNHLEKFERNPYGSGIIVPDHDEKPEDDVLARDSELCKHLLAIASQNPPDIISYVAQLGGSTPMFPAKYPSPPSLEEDVTSQLSVTTLNPTESIGEKQHEPPQQQQQQSPKHQQACPNSTAEVASMPSLDTLAWQYVYAVCNNNSKVANIHISKRSLPGPKTSALHRKNISEVASPDFVVCEKTDGERIILVINPEHGVAYFVSRNLSVQVLSLGNSFNQTELSQWVRGLNGLTVLDGELIDEHSSDQTKQRRAFLCFDAVIVDGEFIGKSHNETLLSRIFKAETFLSKSPLYFFAFSPSPLIFKCKTFTPVMQISDVIARMTPLHSSQQQEEGGVIHVPDLAGWVYDQQNESPTPSVDAVSSSPSTAFPHLSDGLVFTPIGKTYYDYVAYKWKPEHMCTVDFSISMAEVSNAMQRNASTFALTGSVVTHKDSLLPLNQILMTKHQGLAILQSTITTPTVVVECAFVGLMSQWVLKKVRLDRPVPNSLKTAWSNLEVIAESITMECIVHSLQQCQQPQLQQDLQSVAATATDFLVTDHVASVSKHYDLVQASRHTGFRDERIAVHRKVMNWAKACLFKTVMFYSSGTTDKSNAALLSALQKQQLDYSQGKVNFPNLNKPEKKLKKIQNKQNNGSANINVLDIACGRGGDIKKFTSDNLVNMYVGIDISSEQLKDCEERAMANRRVKQCITCLGDASTGAWTKVITRATGLPSASSQFDVAWCMFALHYFCDAEDTLRQLFVHLAECLKVGGKIACTFPNPYHIFEQLKQGRSSDAAKGEKIFKVEREDSGDGLFSLCLDDCLKTFGHAYHFSLGDAVQGCKEFIVPFERVLEIASELGFQVSNLDATSSHETAVSSAPMTMSMNSWISGPCLTSENLAGLRHVMGVMSGGGGKSGSSNKSGNSRLMSSEEWEAISLYMCVVWTKMG